jgi:outer membrane protein assembly factor BamB
MAVALTNSSLFGLAWQRGMSAPRKFHIPRRLPFCYNNSLSVPAEIPVCWPTSLCHFVQELFPPMLTSTFIVALSLMSPAADAASAASPNDWPQWRGQNRDAVSKETGLLKKWPDSGPVVVWKATGLGGGYSTPSVAGGKVFGMSYDGEDEVVWAISEKNGSPLWKTKIAAKVKAGYNEGSRSTPTIDGDLLYCVGMGGDLVCLKTATGELVWQKNYAKDFKGRMMSGWGFSESPLVDGDNVICTPGGDTAALACLNKKTGATVWTAAVPMGGGAGYSSIVKAQVGQTKMYITLLGKSSGVVAVDASNGNLLWKYNKVANGTANIPTVIVRDNFVFCATGYGAGAAVLKMTEESTGSVKADEVIFHPGKELQNHHGGMVLVGDHVYLGNAHNNGFPTCVEFKTGKIVWHEDRGPGTGSAAIAYADGMIYLRYQNGVMALIKADPAKYELVSTFKLPDQSGKASWPHPVIANGKLFIRDQDKMVCFDLKSR